MSEPIITFDKVNTFVFVIQTCHSFFKFDLGFYIYYISLAVCLLCQIKFDDIMKWIFTHNIRNIQLFRHHCQGSSFVKVNHRVGFYSIVL